MSAFTTFQWIISTLPGDPDPRMREYIAAQREYLLSLRSEDERQRFVEHLLMELKKSGNAGRVL